ncbi:MAG: 1-(5-phosphoribosyl)-5-[(5-phosphoribosylamino)methylideneamino]imidazole-4-carboxamide isomerase [Candidatus Omnitrophica bacterium]|nr:1-(5-phosphoribosyl)-5-[(5-phosphoribosylamino)methylideneamino]imidazole-4-carboxamide isomerase [Candidatus Omnitrophota bacterium]
MLILPAIDLKDGCVVRLVQGKFDNKKLYSRDPVKSAKHWAKQGAQFLHVVDLDGALTGEPKNLNVVKEIVSNIGIPVEFGGGVREIDTIKLLLKSGVQRVVLGTKAVEDEAFLKKVYLEFKEQIIVSIDAKDGSVQIKGWEASKKGIDVLTFAATLKNIGFKQIIYTDTQKDGTLTGPNILGIKQLLKETGLEIIASGGISCLEDLKKLKKLEKDGLVGVIVGKALYEGKFTLTEALKIS